MREFLRLEKTFEMLLKYGTGAKSFTSFHQSISVVMEKFLELIAEDTKFGANDTRNKMRRPARPTCPSHCPKSIGALVIRK